MDTKLVINRECGDCNLCCTLLSIDDEPANFHKPSGKTCEHLVAGKCAIHATKCVTCKDYYCMWMVNDPRLVFADGERPDKAGILVSMNDPNSEFSQFVGVPVFTVYEAKPNAFLDYWGQRIIRKLMRKVLIILMPYAEMANGYQVNERTPFLGPPDLINKVKEYHAKLSSGQLTGKR